MVEEALNIQEAGVWDKQAVADIQNNVNVDQAFSNTYDNNKLHYFGNPFVAGPVSHGITKVTKGINTGVYNTLKDNDSPEAPTKADVVTDSNQGAWNAQMDAVQASMQNRANDYDKAKSEDPVQAVLNPFVGGGISTAIDNQQAAAFKNGRIIASPGTAAGSTIIKNR